MSTTTPDDRVTTYNPVVATADFQADFPVFDNSDLSVTVDGIERHDFTVTASYINGVSNDAKASFSPGIIGDVKVIGTRAPRRMSRFQDGGPIPTRDLNVTLDVLAAESQETSRDARLSIKLPFGSTARTYTISENIAAGSLLKVGDDFIIEEGPDAGSVFEEAQAAADAAAASASEAAGSALAAAASANASAASAALSAEASDDAALAADAAEALVIAATAGFAGFIEGMIYDFGSVADPVTYFDQDWGTI